MLVSSISFVSSETGESIVTTFPESFPSSSELLKLILKSGSSFTGSDASGVLTVVSTESELITEDSSGTSSFGSVSFT